MSPISCLPWDIGGMVVQLLRFPAPGLLADATPPNPIKAAPEPPRACFRKRRRFVSMGLPSVASDSLFSVSSFVLVARLTDPCSCVMVAIPTYWQLQISGQKYSLLRRLPSLLATQSSLYWGSAKPGLVILGGFPYRTRTIYE